MGLSPEFQTPGFEFGHFASPISPEPNVIIPSYFFFSSTAESFVRAAYDYGWVLTGFDWLTWAESAEAIQLRDDPEPLRHATPEQLAHLLTLCIREDRISNGALSSAFESGLLTRILERAAVILSEPSPGQA